MSPPFVIWFITGPIVPAHIAGAVHTHALFPPTEIFMKTTVSLLFAAAITLSSIPAHATVIDLSTMSCKQFLEGGDDEIKMVLTWMDGWYKGDEDKAIIDTDVFVENAKK